MRHEKRTNYLLDRSLGYLNQAEARSQELKLEFLQGWHQRKHLTCCCCLIECAFTGAGSEFEEPEQKPCTLLWDTGVTVSKVVYQMLVQNL